MLAALTLILLAGGMNGSFAAPMKRVRGWEWEHTWLVWACLALLVMPLAVAVLTVPNLWAVYGVAGPESLVRTAVYGMFWGASAVLFGLGVTRIGLALGFGIILGTASALGAVVPFVELHRKPALHYCRPADAGRRRHRSRWSGGVREGWRVA